MKIHFVCHICGKRYVASIEQQGKEGKCQKCGHRITVPNVEVNAPDETTSEAERGEGPQDQPKVESQNQKTVLESSSNPHSATSHSLDFAAVFLRFLILATFNLFTFFLCSLLVVLSNAIFPRERLVLSWISAFGYGESAKSLLSFVAGLIGIIRYGVPIFLWLKILKWSRHKINSVAFFRLE